VDPGSTPRYVTGDARKVETVVSNLIAYAVKHTPYGSVTVTAHVLDEPGGRRAEGHVVVGIVISDTGCGIPPGSRRAPSENSSRLTLLLTTDQERAQDKVCEQEITTFAHIDCVVGLGLAIVARIIEHLGGKTPS